MLHDGKGKLTVHQYPALLELESHHGVDLVDLGPAYHTPDSAKKFLQAILPRASARPS